MALILSFSLCALVATAEVILREFSVRLPIQAKVLAQPNAEDKISLQFALRLRDTGKKAAELKHVFPPGSTDYGSRYSGKDVGALFRPEHRASQTTPRND